MATKKITEVDVVNSLSDSDAIFVNSSNSLKQISKSKLVTKGEAGGFYTPAVTQPDANTMRFAFTPSKEGMPAVPPKDITIPGGGGGSGEAGGYYAPSVDDEGNLTWTASKTGMPAVDGANIKGPKGDTGATGATGPKGETGDTGATGADGKSAYAYAVEGGYTGTEKEFAKKLAEGTRPGAYPVVTMTADTAELAPNTYYRWGEISALTITLGAEIAGITNEYCFEFVSGATAATLTVPDTIRWAQEPSIEAVKTYQVSILNGIGVICGA